MRKILYALAAAGLVLSAPTLAAPCKDAKGKFTKCPPAKPIASKPTVCKDAKGKFTKCPPVALKPKVCKDAAGKFAKCGAPGAKPV
jgi:hypothetical protein